LDRAGPQKDSRKVCKKKLIELQTQYNDGIKVLNDILEFVVVEPGYEAVGSLYIGQALRSVFSAGNYLECFQNGSVFFARFVGEDFFNLENGGFYELTGHARSISYIAEVGFPFKVVYPNGTYWTAEEFIAQCRDLREDRKLAMILFDEVFNYYFPLQYLPYSDDTGESDLKKTKRQKKLNLIKLTSLYRFKIYNNEEKLSEVQDVLGEACDALDNYLALYRALFVSTGGPTIYVGGGLFNI
jgi:hypothetical protein